MEEKTKQKRGGQKGNRNAAKHGFYSRIFDEAERFDFNDAAGIEGIDEEIALIKAGDKESDFWRRR